jgi:hypothetical protein
MKVFFLLKTNLNYQVRYVLMDERNFLRGKELN